MPQLSPIMGFMVLLLVLSFFLILMSQFGAQSKKISM